MNNVVNGGVNGVVNVPTWVAALIAFAFVLMVVMLWSAKRRRRPRLDFETRSGVKELVPTIAGLTQGTIVGGNAIRLIQNGEAWESIFRDIAEATLTVHFETFLAKEGELTHRLTELLLRKQQEGVEVRLMLDGRGGHKFGKKDLKRLKDAGVKIGHYHPIRVSNIARMNNRDHRKIVVIDGRVGYVGGHCLVDTWLGTAQDKKHFRDISARVEGPVVLQLQAAFCENWVEETGEVPGGEQFFPQPEDAGTTSAHAVWVSPAGSPSAVKLLHYMAIRAAKKSITIQNPYFLPDPDARKALLGAVKRGVVVRVMIPAASATDEAIVQHASHHHYGTLLKGGVQVFEYQQTLLHQKVITVDGCWSAVGSTNFDDRSFEVNDEVSMAILDEKIAEELERTFEADLEKARAIDLDDWKRRPLLHKLQDFGAYLFNEQL